MANKQHDFVKLARQTVEKYAVDGKIMEAPYPLPEKYDKQSGVFVSIKKKGKLRGCIGTIEATRDNMAEEIIHNAISAAFRDPRFPSVSKNELDKLEYSVDVLGQAEKVDNLDQLDTEKYGVIVEKGRKRGLLLPRLEGIETVEEQLNIARRKAGISAGADIEIYRFEVKRYK
ncbi:MAG: AmmeMemoRadiSam system protein A [Halothermotrichaceae bacterium]